MKLFKIAIWIFTIFVLAITNAQTKNERADILQRAAMQLREKLPINVSKTQKLKK